MPVSPKLRFVTLGESRCARSRSQAQGNGVSKSKRVPNQEIGNEQQIFSQCYYGRLACEVQLRQRVRSQVKLGNETKNEARRKPD